MLGRLETINSDFATPLCERVIFFSNLLHFRNQQCICFSVIFLSRELCYVKWLEIIPLTVTDVLSHYNDVIMGTIASQITSLTIVYSTVYSDADQRKHQSSASLAFVREIHRGPVKSPHKWPVTRTMLPFDDVIMHRELSSRICGSYPVSPTFLHRNFNSMEIRFTLIHINYNDLKMTQQLCCHMQNGRDVIA